MKLKHIRFRDGVASILNEQKMRHMADPRQAIGLTSTQILDRLCDSGYGRYTPPARTLGNALLKTAGVYAVGRIPVGHTSIHYRNVYTIDHERYLRWRNKHAN